MNVHLSLQTVFSGGVPNKNYLEVDNETGTPYNVHSGGSTTVSHLSEYDIRQWWKATSKEDMCEAKRNQYTNRVEPNKRKVTQKEHEEYCLQSKSNSIFLCPEKILKHMDKTIQDSNRIFINHKCCKAKSSSRRNSRVNKKKKRKGEMKKKRKKKNKNKKKG
jgi:hypothetical protein